MFFLLSLWRFFSKKLENKRAEQVLSGGSGKEARGNVAKIMHTQLSKCKNNKINK
jgi:hypothetical protein